MRAAAPLYIKPRGWPWRSRSPAQIRPRPCDGEAVDRAVRGLHHGGGVRGGRVGRVAGEPLLPLRRRRAPRLQRLQHALGGAGGGSRRGHRRRRRRRRHRLLRRQRRRAARPRQRGAARARRRVRRQPPRHLRDAPPALARGRRHPRHAAARRRGRPPPVPVRARLLRPAGAHQRGGGGVRAGVRGGGAAVRGQGHRHLVQDAEVPRLGEVLPQGRAAPDAAREPGAVRGGGVRAQGRQPQPGGAAGRPAALRRHGPRQPGQVVRGRRREGRALTRRWQTPVSRLSLSASSQLMLGTGFFSAASWLVLFLPSASRDV